jgi:predicted metal-dependent phosphoesterase TrpH
VSTGTNGRALLCELHAHSTWSDGALGLRELADLYGRAGFDVLCVTDHALTSEDPWLLEQRASGLARHVHAGNFAAYLEAIDAEAERARVLYGLLLLPGLELTVNHYEPARAAHAVAVGLREYVSPGLEIDEALREARDAGAAILAAHPHGESADRMPLRTTQRFYREVETLAPLVDRFELFNRHDVFTWVAERRLPAVASGDLHRPEHLSSWKTLLPCLSTEEAVVDYLRSPRPAYLLPFRAEPAEEQAAA